MNDFHVVTVANEPKYYFPYLVESCKKHGKELEILGYGEKWKGFSWKFKLMIEYLKKLPKTDIVCFVDGYDVLCVRDLNEMKKIFLEITNKTGCEIIIGINKGETKKYIAEFLGNVFFGSYNGYSINSGMYIGYVNDLLKIINGCYQINNKDDADDQVLMIQYFNKSNTNIYVDSNSDIFLTLFEPLTEIEKYVEISKDTNILTYKSSKPFFLHANGYGYLDELIKKLGYPIEPNKIKNQLFYNFFEKKICTYAFMILKDNIVLIIFFIILCFLIFYISKNYKIIIKKLNKIKII